VEEYAQSHPLKNLDLISQVTQQSIADIDIMVSTTENLGHYLELVTALSDKYKVTITVRKEIESGANFNMNISIKTITSKF
jgi:Mg2+ and Co2+ transporter CorA